MGIKKQVLVLAMALTCVAFTACSGGGKKAEKSNEESATTMPPHEHDTTDKTGPEYTSAYVCPMHCKGSGSDKPGKCPTCGMDYVANNPEK